MDRRVADAMIKAFRDERDRRTALRGEAEDDTGWAYDQWLFTDEPFVSELCLLLLVASRHQLERQLVGIAARLTAEGGDMDGQQYDQHVAQERAQLRRPGAWKNLVARLGLEEIPAWTSSMETLRLLANSYKHHPFDRPDDDLLKHLDLDRSRNYAPLPESECVKEAVALSLGLEASADYTDIAERMLGQIDDFVRQVRSRLPLARVKRGPISLSPSDAEC